VASSEIAALLLLGGRTAHSCFKIPLKIHEDSMCSFAKNSELADLLRITDLIIWHEAPMQHRHVHKCCNHTFQDIWGNDKLFGGIVTVFGGDFKQILPVIVKSSRTQIVGACLQCSHLWHSITVLHLTQNMRLNIGNDVEHQFAEWQLRVGHGDFTDQSDNITLPDHFCTPENTVQSLIDTIYPGLATTAQPDEYFADRTILCSCNDDVHELNKRILDSFPGDEKVYFSAGSIPTGEGNGDQGDLMYPVEYLNTIQCSGLPLSKLTLKIDCPVMVLCNIDPLQGICIGTQGVVTRMQSCVIEIQLLTGDFKGKKAFVPWMSLCPQDTQIPFEFC
jgi:ATP-dependent DNA helicase PIF1